MKIGDIVKVRLKSAPHVVKIGMVIREARKMYMAGDILEVMIGENIHYVKREHVQPLKKGENK